MSEVCGAVIVDLATVEGVGVYNAFAGGLINSPRVSETACVACGRYGLVLFEAIGHLAKSDLSNVVRTYSKVNCFSSGGVTAVSVDNRNESIYVYSLVGMRGDNISAGAFSMTQTREKLGVFRYHLQLMASSRMLTPFVAKNMNPSIFGVLNLTQGMDAFLLSKALLELLA